MPLHDRRTMEGVYGVAQTAQMIRQYRYAEEQMMRIMAGWIAADAGTRGQTRIRPSGVGLRAAHGYPGEALT